jgi:iron complex transport system ATP-binding protein
MSPAITIRGLSHSYGNGLVLDGLDLVVEQGEFLAVVGPNGSGKTTLVRAAAGILATRGTIEIFGKPLRSYARKALARILAVVPQQTPADFPFTVEEVVLMGRSPHLGLMECEKERDREAAREAMTLTDVARLASRRLDGLSGGERQRVIIARAVCQQPRIILLDEPTSSLDLSHQLAVMEIMKGLARKADMTVVMVSHDLNLAALYGDRILLLKDGRALGLGSPSEVLTPERLQEAYGCPLLVDRNPLTGTPRVTLIPESQGDGVPE